MARDGAAGARVAFLWALAGGLRVVWPVLSGLLAAIAGFGALVGVLEGWGVGAGVYFSFVTGLTIGYGDLAPRGVVARMLAVVIGFLGIMVTGLVAALAVSAFQAAARSGWPTTHRTGFEDGSPASRADGGW